MTFSLNPFILHVPVEPDQFFGRKELLAALYTFVRQPRNGLLFVNGPRRSGKSSLLRKIRDGLLQRGFIPVFIDLHGKAEEPLPQMLYELMGAITTAMKIKSEFSINDFEEDDTIFERKFLPSISQTQGKTILLFDEFDALGDRVIVQEDAALKQSAYLKFVPYLHSLCEKSLVSKCIFAIGRSHTDLAECYEPIRNAAVCEHLIEFDLSDTAECITTLSAGSVRFTEAAISAIQKQAKGYPSLVQSLAQSAIDKAQEQKISVIDAMDIEGQLVRTVEKYGEVMSLVVEGTLPQMRAYLILIAKLRERGHMATEKAIAQEMKQLGIDVTAQDIAYATAGLLDAKSIVFNRNFMSYSFTVPLLEKWFSHAYTIKNVADEIRTVDRKGERFLRLAKAKYDEKDFAKAIELYTTVARQYPFSVEACYGLALSLDAGGKNSIETVTTQFEKAYRLDPDKLRHTYKTILKKAYEKENAPPFLEKLVDLGDSTIEDRKTLLRTYFELWRSEILTGHFDQFHSMMKGKPWLLKDYQSEIIGFIDELINEIVRLNPFIVKDFLSLLKGNIEELQLNIWSLRIENNLKKANNSTTEIHSIPESIKQMAIKAQKDEKQQTTAEWKPKKQSIAIAPKDKKRISKVASMSISLGLLVIAVALIGFFSFHLLRRVAMDDPAISKTETLPPVNSPMPELIPDKPMQLEKQDTPQTLPIDSASEYQKMKNEARIMIINASSMYQKGLAAKASARLIAKGFPSKNIIPGNNKNKVSKVYAYYSDKQYIPLVKEILEVLYPKKEKSFFEISSEGKTLNGWIRNFFRDEHLQILIRMPNEE
jgi:tetratricopeptide (TPR) repeat protein